MQNVLPDPGPPRYQLWAISAIYGPIALILLSLALRDFPISDPATALGAFPKLAANAACVDSLKDIHQRDIYVLRFANVAIWAAVLGGCIGLTMRRANLGVWKPAANTPGQNTVPHRVLQEAPLYQAARHLPLALLGVLAVALSWWIVFHASACYELGRGIPEYRAFDGVVPAVLAGVPGFFLGLASDWTSIALRHGWRATRKPGQ